MFRRGKKNLELSETEVVQDEQVGGTGMDTKDESESESRASVSDSDSCSDSYKPTQVEEDSDETDEGFEDDYDDDYMDDEVPRRGFSLSSFLLTLSVFALIGVIGFVGYKGYKTYTDIFPSKWCECRLEKPYLDTIEKLGTDYSSYMVSPLGMDLSLIELSGEKGFEPTQMLNVITQSNRGYQSLGESNSKLFELAEEETYKNFKDITETTGTEIMDYLGTDYTLDESFHDTDMITVFKLPEKMKGDVTEYENEVFLKGKYYKADKAFKVDYADDKHEIIFYKDKYPDEDDWKEVEGTLVVPKESMVFTTSATQTVRSMFGDKNDAVDVTQVVKYEMSGTGEPDNLEYTNKVGNPYKVVVRNKNTGIIVAGGVITSEAEE